MSGPIQYPDFEKGEKQSTSPYNSQPRAGRDRLFGFLYVVALIAVIGLGGYADANKTDVQAYNVQNATVCGAAAPQLRAGESSLPSAPKRFFGGVQAQEAFLSATKAQLGLSLAGSIVVGVLYLTMLKFFARSIVKLTALIIITMPALGAVYALKETTAENDMTTLGYCLAGAAALLALCCFLARKKLDLCGRLIEVAAAGLQANSSLILIVVALKVLLVGLLVALLVLLVPLLSNGTFQQAPQVAAVANGACTDAQGMPTDCCVFQMEGWASGGLALNIVMMYWTVFLIFEIRLYTIAGAFAQWYWAPPRSSTRGFVTKPLKEAFSSMFGTLCLAGFVLFICHVINDLAEKTRRSKNPAAKVMAACLACLAGLIKELTQFTTIQCAISGEAFCRGGKTVCGVLGRNSLSTISVWWIPGFVLNFTVFVLSGIDTAVVYYAVKASLLDRGDLDSATVHSYSAIACIVAGLACYVVLHFLMSILLNCVDAAFVCYGHDKENRSVTQPDIHECFDELPTVKASQEEARLIRNPDSTPGAGYAATSNYA